MNLSQPNTGQKPDLPIAPVASPVKAEHSNENENASPLKQVVSLEKLTQQEIADVLRNLADGEETPEQRE